MCWFRYDPCSVLTPNANLPATGQCAHKPNGQDDDAQDSQRNQGDEHRSFSRISSRCEPNSSMSQTPRYCNGSNFIEPLPTTGVTNSNYGFPEKRLTTENAKDAERKKNRALASKKPEHSSLRTLRWKKAFLRTANNTNKKSACGEAQSA